MQQGSPKQSKESIRLFESAFLEWFSHVHPITPLLIWGPVVGWTLWRSVYVDHLSAFAILGTGALGLLVWTLVEYLFHRFLFHFVPRTPGQERLIFIIHGIHHEDPQDATRLVMPPFNAIIMGGLLYLGFRAILGTPWIDPFYGFFILGYLCYDYIHFGVHHFTPRTPIGRYLKQTHMIHHYAMPNARWGVSSPLWDWVFGTLEEPVREREPRSSSAQS